MSRDKDYRRLIHTVRWLRLRREVLTARPLCERCAEEGRVSAATEVHHVVPCETAANAREMETLMFNPHNLMALCHRCHVEEHMRLGKGGRKERRKRADAKLRDFARRFLGEQAED